MRLIDADEIKKRERDVVLANGAKHRCFDTTLLVEIPTIDAVEVVRCKNCEYCATVKSFGKEYLYCDAFYEHAVEQLEHDMTFEPTYNPEDGSM